jgi:hypothetical protein
MKTIRLIWIAPADFKRQKYTPLASPVASKTTR